ncbi:MAG: M16 family metallopeptidase [Planctomycetota bacterium]|jgi:predicted Zn-dependent peptidase
MPVEFKQTRLANGLTVVAEVDPRAHSAAIGFFVKTGARDEPAPIMGVSHYLEHMMFKGTETRDASAVDREFDGLGADHNAFTTSEMTAFYAHALPEHLAAAEEILSDIMRPSLRAQDLEDERSVILEEIAMYDDQPFWMLYERAMEEYYGDHPLSHRVLGTKETVSALQPEQMRDYFESRYSSDNTVVAMAGALDFDAMVARLEEHCGHWTVTDAARTHPSLTFTPGAFDLRSATVNQCYGLLSCPGPAATDDRRYAASMLMQILGDAEGSRLYWALVETGLAEEAQAQYSSRDGLGEMMLYFVCDPDDQDRVLATCHQQVAALVDSLTAEDLQRVRSKVATGATLQGELPAGRMRRLGRCYTYHGAWIALEEELERIAAVTLDDLRSVAEAFPLDEWLIGTMRPSSDSRPT